MSFSSLQALATAARSRVAGLADLLDFWCAASPSVVAAVEGDRSLTYLELQRAVDGCAQSLIALGLRKGDRVAMLDQPGIDFLVVFLATARVGGIWVGLNPRYTDHELERVVSRVNPTFLFVRDRIEDRRYSAWLDRCVGVRVRLGSSSGQESSTGVLSVDEFLERGWHGAALPEKASGDDPCLIVFTSGSTGIPKGVVIDQAALVGTGLIQAEIWKATPLRVLNNLPINHIGCVGDLSCYALAAGGTSVFSARFDPRASLELIERESITVWGQVPAMFQMTLEHPSFESRRIRSLQLIFWGGATASPELVDRLAALGKPLATSYGQTETVGSIAFTPRDATRELLVGTVGRVVPPYEVRIARADPSSAEGEIEVRSPFAMVGYWQDDAVEPVASEWRKTGDIGRLSEAGDITLLGRVHDVFKSGGYNIYPAEIEAVLQRHPAVRRAAVIGMPDALFGQVAVAFVEADHSRIEAELQALAERHLANFKRPKRIVFLEQLPLLPVGKVDKKTLAATHQHRT